MFLGRLLLKQQQQQPLPSQPLTAWSRNLPRQRPRPRQQQQQHQQHVSRRWQSSSSPPPSSSTSPTPKPDAKTQERVNKVLGRVPRFLRKYTDGLRNAPVTHVVAFLLLHELTAVVPLVGLAGYFHYSQWLPGYFSQGKFVSDGIEKFGSYFRKKGWFGFQKEDSKRAKIWNFSESGSRIVVEVATAYAVTKAILPLRIMFSLWLTPWFARVFVARLTGRVWRIFSRGGGKTAVGKTASMPAAGTGATWKGTSTVVNKVESK